MPADCIFCQIVAGTAPSWQVYETEYACAFLDRYPATAGHTLVVPRKHAADIWDIGREDAGRLMEAVHDVARLLDERLRPDGMTLFQANRAAGWQDVFHMHVHLVPRYAGDQLRKSWRAQSVTDRELDEVRDRIRPKQLARPEADLMAAQLTTLSSSDIRRFERDGYVVVRQAFSRDDALSMERQWWHELEDDHGIRRDDRSSWRQIMGNLKAAKRDPLQARILTARVRGVFDDLLGTGAWSRPRNWGRTLVTFPEPGAWDVPARLWHWDNPCELHLERPRALFVVSFIGPVGPQGGGTLILSGSPRLLIQQVRRIPAGQRRGPVAMPRERFHRSHPWLMALTGQAPSPADRIAAFMDTEAIVDGVPLRVVELTGEPGDMVFCHPVMVHCVAPNRGTRPRFMRIKTQVLTREGRELRDSLARQGCAAPHGAAWHGSGWHCVQGSALPPGVEFGCGFFAGLA